MCCIPNSNLVGPAAAFAGVASLLLVIPAQVRHCCNPNLNLVGPAAAFAGAASLLVVIPESNETDVHDLEDTSFLPGLLASRRLW